MHDFNKNRLPTCLNWLFQRTENVRNQLTRLLSTRELRTQKFNASTNGLSSLCYTGTKAFNSLKNEALFNNVINKSTLSAYFQIRPLSLTKQLGITNIIVCH